MHLPSLHSTPLLMLRWGMALSFCVCIYLNTIGVTTIAEISHRFKCDLTPSAPAFTIWGAVYVALFLFVCRENMFPSLDLPPAHAHVVYLLFLASCYLNILWLELFGHEWIQVSFLVLLALWFTTFCLYGLMVEAFQMPIVKCPSREPDLYLSTKLSDYLCLRLPFTLYCSWLTSATVVQFCLTCQTHGYVLSNWFYGFAILLLIAIHTSVLIYERDVVFAIVGIWTLIWINPTGNIIVAVLAMLGWMGLTALTMMTLFKSTQPSKGLLRRDSSSLSGYQTM